MESLAQSASGGPSLISTATYAHTPTTPVPCHLPSFPSSPSTSSSFPGALAPPSHGPPPNIVSTACLPPAEPMREALQPSLAQAGMAQAGPLMAMPVGPPPRSQLHPQLHSLSHQSQLSPTAGFNALPGRESWAGGGGYDYIPRPPLLGLEVHVQKQRQLRAQLVAEDGAGTLMRATGGELGYASGHDLEGPLPPSHEAQAASSFYSVAMRDQRRATLPLAHTDLESELQIRHNMLIEQQHKIGRLEAELAKARMEIERLSAKVKQLEQERTKGGPKKTQSRYWTPEEHQRFLEGVEKFGAKDVKAIAAHVGTRNPTQVRTHAQKYYLRIDREKKRKEEREQKERDGKEKGSSEALTNDPLPTTLPEVEGNNSCVEDHEAKDSVREEENEEAENSTSSYYDTDCSVESSADPTFHILKAAVLSSVPGWDAEEYDIFVKALAHAPVDTTDEKRLTLVQDLYLPHKSMDDLIALHNYRLEYFERQKPISPNQQSTEEGGEHLCKRPRIATSDAEIANNSLCARPTRNGVYSYRPWEAAISYPYPSSHYHLRRMSMPALHPSAHHRPSPPLSIPQNFYAPPPSPPAPVLTPTIPSSHRRMSAPNLVPIMGGSEPKPVLPTYTRHRLSLPGDYGVLDFQDRRPEAPVGVVWSSRVLGVSDRLPLTGADGCAGTCFGTSPYPSLSEEQAHP